MQYQAEANATLAPGVEPTASVNTKAVTDAAAAMISKPKENSVNGTENTKPDSKATGNDTKPADNGNKLQASGSPTNEKPSTPDTSKPLNPKNETNSTTPVHKDAQPKNSNPNET